MGKMIKTKEIEKAIVPFEEFNEIAEKRYWGDDPQNDFFAIDGEDAMTQAKKTGIMDLKTYKLSPGVFYVFRWNLKKTKIIPQHVTMLRKTYENIIKGSERYGSTKIVREFN